MIRENAVRMWVWIQESWDVWEEEEFSEDGEREWEAQREKEFWIGCRTHFCAVLVRRTPAAVCHKDPCALQYFFFSLGAGSAGCGHPRDSSLRKDRLDVGERAI